MSRDEFVQTVEKSIMKYLITGEDGSWFITLNEEEAKAIAENNVHGWLQEYVESWVGEGPYEINLESPV